MYIYIKLLILYDDTDINSDVIQDLLYLLYRMLYSWYKELILKFINIEKKKNIENIEKIYIEKC